MEIISIHFLSERNFNDVHPNPSKKIDYLVNHAPLLRHIAVMGHAGVGVLPRVGGSGTLTLALRQDGLRLSRINWLTIGANIVADRVILF
jgi:hypothetical protein